MAAGMQLPMPTLDAEKGNLLQQIIKEGGFAYANLANLAVNGDFKAAEAAHEIAWEQLHAGPWHSVLPVWRDAYSMSCLLMAAVHHGAGEFSEALRVLDMGLIMGGRLLRKDLDSAVSILVRSDNDMELGNGICERDCESPPCLDFDSGNVEVLKVLPDRSLLCKKIEKRSSLSLEGFLCDYFLSGSPVIISGHIARWPAMRRWKDMGYLKRVAGGRTVPVEVGKNYLDTEWKQELITFSEFLDRIQSGECSTAPTYLAQHPLFDQIQELHKDILVPDYCTFSGGELKSVNAWFGPAGTVTPLHHDPHHNLLAQVVGRKYVRLYSASVSEDLYPHHESMLSNSSQVDLDNIDATKFPAAQNLDFMDCLLEEGEMLYIPPKWWHYVRSLANSFSVSFWWSTSDS